MDQSGENIQAVNGSVDLKAKSDEEEARECQKDFMEVTCESSNCP